MQMGRVEHADLRRAANVVEVDMGCPIVSQSLRAWLATNSDSLEVGEVVVSRKSGDGNGGCRNDNVDPSQTVSPVPVPASAGAERAAVH